jgi:hypothetical protein
MKKMLMLLFISMVVNCSLTSSKATSSSVISTSKHKIYIAPVLNTANLDSLPSWPVDKKREGTLLKKLAGIRKILISKIKQSDCANTVQIVQNSDQPEYRVTITLTSVSLINDSLTIPLRVEIENIRSGSIRTFSMNSTGMYRIRPQKSNASVIDSLFSRYQTSFPYTNIIGYICNN